MRAFTVYVHQTNAGIKRVGSMGQIPNAATER